MCRYVKTKMDKKSRKAVKNKKIRVLFCILTSVLSGAGRCATRTIPCVNGSITVTFQTKPQRPCCPGFSGSMSPQGTGPRSTMYIFMQVFKMFITLCLAHYYTFYFIILKTKK